MRPKPVGHEDLNEHWVGAGHLKVGDKIQKADGGFGVVKYVNTVEQTRTMYNLEVREAHTFFVGTGGWLVHNGGETCLIGANKAIIDPRKLTEYALNPAHPIGGNKAKVFESALGFNLSNADELVRQLRAGAVEVIPTAGKVDRFGTRFTLDIPVTGPKGSGVVRTGWIYKPGSSIAELTTLYVK